MTEYQEALRVENVFFEQYEDLELSEAQRKVIEQWTDAIHAKNAAYSMVIFRKGCNAVFPYWCNRPRDLRKTAKTLILCGIREYQNKI